MMLPSSRIDLRSLPVPRLAVFLPNWIGDVVMATPFLRALRMHIGPQAEIVGVMRPYVAEVLTGTHWLSETWLHDPRGKSGGLSNLALIRALRAKRLNGVALLTNSLRTGALAWLSGAQHRLGYARDWRGWMLTHALTPQREHGQWTPISAVDYYLALAQAWGCEAKDRRLELACTAHDKQAAETAWRKLNLLSQRPTVAFHAAGGWGGTATAKAWPVEHFAALARRIVAKHDVQVLVLCGPNEREAAREIVRQAKSERVVSLAEEPLSIGLTKGCLQRTSLLVSTDSGPRHIATAFQVPTVGLFGATDPRWAETYHPDGITIYNQLECGPCGEQHCPLKHHACMRELSVERVFAAVEKQLARFQVRAA